MKQAEHNWQHHRPTQSRHIEHVVASSTELKVRGGMRRVSRWPEIV